MFKLCVVNLLDCVYMHIFFQATKPQHTCQTELCIILGLGSIKSWTVEETQACLHAEKDPIQIPSLNYEFLQTHSDVFQAWLCIQACTVDQFRLCLNHCHLPQTWSQTRDYSSLIILEFQTSSQETVNFFKKLGLSSFKLQGSPNWTVILFLSSVKIVDSGLLMTVLPKHCMHK